MLTAWRSYTVALATALDADDRAEALRRFMRLAGSFDDDRRRRSLAVLVGSASARADA